MANWAPMFQWEGQTVRACQRVGLMCPSAALRYPLAGSMWRWAAPPYSWAVREYRLALEWAWEEATYLLEPTYPWVVWVYRSATESGSRLGAAYSLERVWEATYLWELKYRLEPAS